jgi:hypothetical protein
MTKSEDRAADKWSSVSYWLVQQKKNKGFQGEVAAALRTAFEEGRDSLREEILSSLGAPTKDEMEEMMDSKIDTHSRREE